MALLSGGQSFHLFGARIMVHAVRLWNLSIYRCTMEQLRASYRRLHSIRHWRHFSARTARRRAQFEAIIRGLEGRVRGLEEDHHSGDCSVCQAVQER